MRIVGGRWRGRRINAPEDEGVRPTGDRVRGAWLSIVNAELPGARVLDLFAGSGALGFDALSRGAALVHFVERAPASLTTLRANADLLGAGSAVVIHPVDAMQFVDSLPPDAYDVAFADPPYDLGIASAIAARWLAVPFAHVLGVEHRDAESVTGAVDRRRYGGTAISFFRR